MNALKELSEWLGILLVIAARSGWSASFCFPEPGRGGLAASGDRPAVRLRGGLPGTSGAVAAKAVKG